MSLKLIGLTSLFIQHAALRSRLMNDLTLRWSPGIDKEHYGVHPHTVLRLEDCLNEGRVD